MKFSIYRYNPETDREPYMQDFNLDVPVGTDKMLLDALISLKEQDETITFRRSCREGVCGSDGMNINGKNGLACITPLSSLSEPVVIRPLPGFPVVRDLVVDMDQFLENYKSVEPYLINGQIPPAKERLQSPEERAKLDGLYECILCACCSSSCPSYWWNPETYAGPAALLWMYRFVADSRDDAKSLRLSKLADDTDSLFRCRSIMNCVDVCPKGLSPFKAINALRSAMVEEAS